MPQPNTRDQREAEWSALMRAGLAGDAEAYRRLLALIAPVLRRMAQKSLSRAGNAEAEDVVQEILLAIHLKRQTWLADQPLTPWLNAIARHKLIDALRRRGRRVFVNIDDFSETLAGEPAGETLPPREVAAHLQTLPVRQRDVLQSIAVDSASIKATAAKLSMSEGAVRVALHRGLAALTARLRKE